MYMKGFGSYVSGLAQDPTVTAATLDTVPATIDTGAPTVTPETLDTVPATVTAVDAATGAAASSPASSNANTGGWFGSLLNTVQQAVTTLTPAAMSVYTQTQMANVNAQRAAKGLPPLTGAQYQAQYGTPTATVQAQLAPQTQQMIYYVAGGIALVALVIGLRKRG